MPRECDGLPTTDQLHPSLHRLDIFPARCYSPFIYRKPFSYNAVGFRSVEKSVMGIRVFPLREPALASPMAASGDGGGEWRS